MLRWTSFACAILSTTLAIAADPALVENDVYRLTTLTIPEGAVLEIGAMDLLPDGRLAVSTRRGEIWLVGSSHAVTWNSAVTGDWGAGGAEFHWWCTESADAFIDRDPVWKTMADEITAMVGELVYEQLADFLRARTKQMKRASTKKKASVTFLPHPAVRRETTPRFMALDE